MALDLASYPSPPLRHTGTSELAPYARPGLPGGGSRLLLKHVKLASSECFRGAYFWNHAPQPLSGHHGVLVLAEHILQLAAGRGKLPRLLAGDRSESFRKIPAPFRTDAHGMQFVICRWGRQRLHGADEPAPRLAHQPRQGPDIRGSGALRERQLRSDIRELVEQLQIALRPKYHQQFGSLAAKRISQPFEQTHNAIRGLHGKAPGQIAQPGQQNVAVAHRTKCLAQPG